jgi:hypothetical protein
MEISVVLAQAGAQRAVRLTVPGGTTAQDAVDRSGLLEHLPAAQRAGLGLAIYGKAVDPGRPLEGGDRVEILRPLVHEPKSRRRERARLGGTMGGTAGKRQA